MTDSARWVRLFGSIVSLLAACWMASLLGWKATGAAVLLPWGQRMEVYRG